MTQDQRPKTQDLRLQTSDIRHQTLSGEIRDTRNEIRGLYAIVDNTFSPKKSHFELASEFLIGGCKVLQLRIKKPGGALWDSEIFEVAKEIMELKKRYDFTFIINDYVDVAAELKADGIHAGSNDMPVDEIRKRVGPDYVIGYSSHSIDEALAAEKNGADYVAFGAIYFTKTKGPGHPVQGVDKLKELVKKLNVPAVAIGGINRANIDEVLLSGVASVAMITGLACADDVVAETRWYVNKISNPKLQIPNRSQIPISK